MGGRGTGSDRNSQKFNITSGGGVEGYGKKEQAFARRLFGKNISGAELATMSGAGGFTNPKIEVGIKGDRLQVDIFHRYISKKDGKKDGMTRSFFKANGKTTIENEAFFLTKNAQGRGIGREALRTQMVAAKRNGVKNVTLFALRNDARKDPAIGHKVWGDLGFNAKLNTASIRAWNGRNPLAKLSGTKEPRTVRELYNTKGGRAIWHQYGGSTRMNFSLSRGSQSLKAFNAYLRKRGLSEIK